MLKAWKLLQFHCGHMHRTDNDGVKIEKKQMQVIGEMCCFHTGDNEMLQTSAGVIQSIRAQIEQFPNC